MSEQTDEAQKTEEPTPKKISEARKRGNVARSMEINTWLMLFAGTVIVAMVAPGMMGDIRAIALIFIERPHEYGLDTGNLPGLLLRTVSAVGVALIVPAIFLVVFALATGLVQNGLVFSPKAIEPKFEKLSPITGAKRFASWRQWIEFFKGILKIMIVGTIAVLLLMPEFERIDTLPTVDLLDLLGLLHVLVLKLLIYVLGVLFFVAFVDVVFQRANHRKQLRMTKQEVKDEFKQAEGDPHVKGRLRQIRMDRARQRMMQAVPEADVVVTNPTHFAVALKYKQDEMEAPVLVAKGQDLIAQKIREVAEDNDIPIVENKPLAQALFKTVELDQEVPTEHYKAVAEIISYVWRMRGQFRPNRPAA
ncbi:MAG: flagellar biosynthesis protein FlhB [Alphaproteobacteria bacterium]|nr:flagellar biosynthesis protein FlhB [Alphaproteobacteria bacterium]